MTEWLRKQAAYLRNIDSGSGDARELEAAAEHIEELEAALTTIRDTLPLENDEYARRVFAVAANALEK